MYDERVYVSNDDIAAAKRAWMDGRDGGSPRSRVEQLEHDYQQLVDAQARQISDHFLRSWPSS